MVIATMKANRVDNNQQEIIDALRQVGAMVQPLNAVKCGCPDLLVGYKCKLYLMEVKSESGTLTEWEWQWLEQWYRSAGVLVYIVRSVEDALRVIGIES